MIGGFRNPTKRWQRARTIVGVLGLAYAAACLSLLLRQRDLIYRPKLELSMLPSASAFNLPYQDVEISISGSPEPLHGWWIPAASPQANVSVIADEPIQILNSPKVMLYLYGVGNNMGDYNYLARVAAFRQLGFSVLVFDYRGYGRSRGDFPNEGQMYEDAQAAWNYLRDRRNVPADQILIYGESLGGAIALNLAVKHPDAGGLMMQSSFTSMAEAVKSRAFFKLFPIDFMLTEHFDSIAKIKSLRVPVLFLHGSSDSVVPPEMSQRLYDAAPDPKQLCLIAGADHVRIYQPGAASYLRAIQRFIESLPQHSDNPQPPSHRPGSVRSHSGYQ